MQVSTRRNKIVSDGLVDEAEIILKQFYFTCNHGITVVERGHASLSDKISAYTYVRLWNCQVLRRGNA